MSELSEKWETKCREDARLVILAELAAQRDARLNSRILAEMVDQVVRHRPGEWIDAQLRWLASMDAVELQEGNLPGLGPVHFVTLRQAGRNHVTRRQFLPGVTIPVDQA